ncbi:hypothetical protein V8D89_011960 [Ganoderma adspersum]
MDARRGQADRLQEIMGSAHASAQDMPVLKREAPITFSNPKAQDFYVDGTKIPDVKFDAGPSWSGLMPISGAANETRKLFFWFWPTNNASNVNDLLFWTNGGPGCSSLEGFLQENGPISWSWGQSEPTPNPWSWTNLSNVLWVEQPVGTGFSQGVPNITNDDELAAQVAGFLEQFLEVFTELKGSNFYVSGESVNVPYIANYLYENPNQNLNLKGIWIADPTISWFLVQSQIPALRFVQANQNVFPFNSTFVAQLQNVSDACGYTNYLDNVTYPPSGPLPLPAAAFIDDEGFVDFGEDCDIQDMIVNAVTETDVQDAIHAPHIEWSDCAAIAPYVNETDNSVPPAANHVLSNVIEKSERTAVVHGLAVRITFFSWKRVGVLMNSNLRTSSSNMTWNGKQGFQTPIEDQSFLVDNMGVYGNYHTERGLTYVEFYYSGHMTPLDFDAGPSWAGLMPISGAANETRKLFFWFWPTNNASNVKDLLFWTNGGPGCSSLDGFLQENGPISWNPWSWTNLSNVLWVEQPVGTGFSQGDPSISNDDELAAQLQGFFEQFLEVFSELKGSNFFLSGESVNVPYIANYFYEHPNPDLKLKGAWIADPTLSWNLVQQEIPALRFAQANKNVFPFNSTFWATLQNISDSCGYTNYLDSVTYPPNGLLPLPTGAAIDNTTGAVVTKPECEIHDLIQMVAGQLNPVFDVYRVTDMYPSPWSVLGFPQSTQEFIYFNRRVAQVQDAINVPNMNWEICSGPVYVDPATGGPGYDQSLPSALSVLPNVIEKSERVAIVHGLADFILVAEGTRIAIQNMTWNRTQGFQSPIGEDNFLVDNLGAAGNMHTERGLTFATYSNYVLNIFCLRTVPRTKMTGEDAMHAEKQAHQHFQFTICSWVLRPLGM